MKIVLVAVPLINTRVPPLSIASIKAYLEKQGHIVKAFDFNIETYHNVSVELKEYWTYYKGFQWDDSTYFENYIYPSIIGKNVSHWAEKIISERPEIVGISVTGSPSGRILAKELKRIQPEIKIVIGGPGCSKTFNDPEKIPCELYDAVVHNEGEVSFTELISEYQRHQRFVPVKGCSVLDENGKIILTKLEEKTLKSLSEKTGGTFIRSVSGDIDVKKIYELIKSSGEDKDFTAGKKYVFEDRFQIFLSLGLLLLIIEFLL